MRIVKLNINNFRGIKTGEVLLSDHTVLVGDNNSGKSTVLEAIDLVLGPERLSRYPVIDEHDFYAGIYDGENPPEIYIEVLIVDLSDTQLIHFKDNIEWWDEANKKFVEGPSPEGTDEATVLPALRLAFSGCYDKEEDDFTGETYFLHPPKEEGPRLKFGTRDKRLCGFLFLRTHRTGSRALSLERGSLLDIILRLKELRPQMWEKILEQLRGLSVVEDPALGISSILSSVQDSVRSFVPSDWAENPNMKVSDMTREHLRKTLTVFMSTGAKRADGSAHAAPFQHQGVGTINVLVLALLSLIAKEKQNVIFAMEEPEIAIPPYTQKRIIDSICKQSAQAIFTSHSPYVLEEFKPSQILVINRKDGILSNSTTDYPPTVKPKSYRKEFRKRFCEALLSCRILIAEGNTEYDAWPAAARRLCELQSDRFKTLDALGIAMIDAESDSQIAPLGEYFKGLGKTVFAVFDKQEADKKSAIVAAVNHPFEAAENGFEKMVLNGTAESALRRYGLSIVSDGNWPSHLTAQKPTTEMSLQDLKDTLFNYLQGRKGEGSAAELLSQCSLEEMPVFIVETLTAIQTILEPPPVLVISEEEFESQIIQEAEQVKDGTGDTLPESV